MDAVLIFSWLARGLLIAGGFVASWFLTKDSPQFGLMETAVTILLFVFAVAVVALRPKHWTHILNRFHRAR